MANPIRDQPRVYKEARRGSHFIAVQGSPETNTKRESYFEQARETLLYTGGRLYSMRDHPRISNLQVREGSAEVRGWQTQRGFPRAAALLTLQCVVPNIHIIASVSMLVGGANDFLHESTFSSSPLCSHATAASSHPFRYALTFSGSIALNRYIMTTSRGSMASRVRRLPSRISWRRRRSAFSWLYFSLSETA